MGLISNVAAHNPITSTWGNAIRDQGVQTTTSGARPGSPAEGFVIYETDTDRLMVYDGSGWAPLVSMATTAWTPTVTQSVTRTGATVDGWYSVDGCWVSAQLLWVSSVTGSNNVLYFSAPGSLTPSGTADNQVVVGWGDFFDTGLYYGLRVVATTSGLALRVNTASTDPSGFYASSLALSHQFSLNLHYRYR